MLLADFRSCKAYEIRSQAHLLRGKKILRARNQARSAIAPFAVGATSAALAGAAIGAAAGAIAGEGAAEVVGGAAAKGVAGAVNPAAEDGHWRASYGSAPYYQSGRTYEDYEPAYRLGYYGWSRYGGAFDQSEDRLSNEWKSVKGQSRLAWNEAKQATRAAWDRVERAIPGDSDHDGK